MARSLFEKFGEVNMLGFKRRKIPLMEALQQAEKLLLRDKSFFNSKVNTSVQLSHEVVLRGGD